MLAQRTKRRLNAIAVTLGWVIAAGLGLGALLAGSARSAARYVACEAFVAALSTTSTMLYTTSRRQSGGARRYESCPDSVMAAHMEWAMDLGREMEDARRRIPGQKAGYPHPSDAQTR